MTQIKDGNLSSANRETIDSLHVHEKQQSSCGNIAKFNTTSETCSSLTENNQTILVDNSVYLIQSAFGRRVVFPRYEFDCMC